jgi:hypothetical protein
MSGDNSHTPTTIHFEIDASDEVCLVAGEIATGIGHISWGRTSTQRDGRLESLAILGCVGFPYEEVRHTCASNDWRYRIESNIMLCIFNGHGLENSDQS